MKRKNNIFKKREEKSHQIWSQSNQIVFDIFSLADTILAIMRLVFSLYYYYEMKKKKKKYSFLFRFGESIIIHTCIEPENDLSFPCLFWLSTSLLCVK